MVTEENEMYAWEVDVIKHIGEIQDIYKLPFQGWTAEVYQITNKHQHYLLKIASKKNYRLWLKQEAEAMKRYQDRKGFSIPKYYQFWEDSQHSYLLMSFINGVPLRIALERAKSEKEKQQLLVSFGLFLNQFHSIPVENPQLSTEQWLNDELQKALQSVQNNECDGTMELWEHIQRHRPSSNTPTFIHGDCTIDNVLVVNGEVAYFIDIAGMTTGDPRYDEALAIRKMIHHPRDLASFYEGYNRKPMTTLEFTYFNHGLYEFF